MVNDENDFEFNDNKSELPDAADFEERYIKEHELRISLAFENQKLTNKLSAMENLARQINDSKSRLEALNRKFEAMREAKESAERQAQEQASLRATENQAFAEEIANLTRPPAAPQVIAAAPTMAQIAAIKAAERRAYRDRG